MQIFPLKIYSALEIGPLKDHFSLTIRTSNQASCYFPKEVENLTSTQIPAQGRL